MILSVFKKTFQEVQKYWKIYCYSLAWNLMKQEQLELSKGVIDLNHVLARVIDTVNIDAQAKHMVIETNILSNETKTFANEELMFIAF